MIDNSTYRPKMRLPAPGSWPLAPIGRCVVPGTRTRRHRAAHGPKRRQASAILNVTAYSDGFSSGSSTFRAAAS
jgi:hypothetical protein